MKEKKFFIINSNSDHEVSEEQQQKKERIDVGIERYFTDHIRANQQHFLAPLCLFCSHDFLLLIIYYLSAMKGNFRSSSTGIYEKCRKISLSPRLKIVTNLI